ncbi:2-hydroxyacid dehydrogenase [Pokkaliibacter sp. CJK22405]|uniref:2-hydroxyacid dehydrogenase n=1 Tax=Pokkaliibacter sp. CJK22405 TaxID=3384615 RepID=UPI0039848ACB
MTLKAVYLDEASLNFGDLDMLKLSGSGVDYRGWPSTPGEKTLERLEGVQVAIVNKHVLTAETLRALPELKVILISATGTNNVDLLAAKELGIQVCNCQGYGTPSVAQHTLMLMLVLATRFTWYQADIAEGQWQKSSMFCLADYPIEELTGKTLGIVGYGELGQAVAKLAEAFGMKVLIAGRPGQTVREGRLALDELLPKVDILSLHCPLNDDTRDLIDKRRLGLMKTRALLVNTARGGVVNEEALHFALSHGIIAGAATDVLTTEPPREGNILLDQPLDNLIVTPHNAWASVQSRQRMIDQLAHNLTAWKGGKELKYRVI